MSWSKSNIRISRPEDLDKVELTKEDCYNSDSPEIQEQFRACKEAAKLIITSRSVGGDNKHFLVNVNGHANKDHEPVSHSANDCGAVYVAQVSA